MCLCLPGQELLNWMTFDMLVDLDTGSSSKVKVMGQSSMLPKINVDEVIGAASGDGFSSCVSVL